MRQVFLDHQSGTPVLNEVFEAMRPFFMEHYGNPSSLHRFGLAARDALAKARNQVATLINAEYPEEILFTSSGTEAVNLAVKGAAYASQRRGNHIIVSEVEHPAVLNSVDFLEKQGFVCTRVAVNSMGFVAPEDVAAAVTDKTILICIQHVNHDIGTIQPIREIGLLAQEKGVALFVDAVASAGWCPINVQEIGASLLAVSPHRFYGPKGVGVLYRNRRTRLTNLVHGGNQEGGRRGGTENVPGIVGAGVASELAFRELDVRSRHVSNLQKRLWEKFCRRIPFIRLNGPEPGETRLGTNLNVSFEFVEGEGLLLSLDMMGIAASSGTACLSKSLKVSHVLSAIGLELPLAQGSLLFSFGRENTHEELDYVVDSVVNGVGKLREMSAAWDEFKRGAIDSLISPRTSCGEKVQ